jgi:hypothetical protein
MAAWPALILAGALSCDGGATNQAVTGAGRYIVATAISTDDGANTYVKVLDEIGGGELDLSAAREFPGWSDLKVAGGKIFVSDGEAPIVYRFSVGADGKLVPEGQIGFGDYTTDASMYVHVFVSDEKAYLLGEAGEYVVWNPRTMKIVGTIPLPMLQARESIEPAPALDRGMIVRDGRLYHAVAWTDYENFKLVPGSAIVVTDTVTDTVVETLEVECPDLNVGEADSRGNLYFSNWVYSPGGTLVNGGPKACAVKIPAGATTVDEAWTLQYATVVGHEAAALAPVDADSAILSVFFEDHEAFDSTQDEIFSWVFGNNWKTYRVGLDGKAGAEVEGLPWHSGGYYKSDFDGKTYLLLPGDEYKTTTVYELGTDGPAQVKITTQGWATRLYKL